MLGIENVAEFLLNGQYGVDVNEKDNNGGIKPKVIFKSRLYLGLAR